MGNMIFPTITVKIGTKHGFVRITTGALDSAIMRYLPATIGSLRSNCEYRNLDAINYSDVHSVTELLAQLADFDHNVDGDIYCA